MSEQDINRADDLRKGMGKGAIKETIFSLTDPISNEIRDLLVSKFGDESPIVNMLAGTGSKALTLLLLAEILGLAGSQLDGIIGDAGEKSQLLARFIREVVGEEIAAQGVKEIFKNIPAVVDLFGKVNTDDIKYALGEKSEVFNQRLPNDAFEDLVNAKETVQTKKEAEVSVTITKE